LINPAGGRGRVRRHLDQLLGLAQAAGIASTSSSSPDDLTGRAGQAAAAGVERLIVAGGDGSQHLAVQGLVGSACALAPLPLGSGNDLAGTLGVPANPIEAFGALLEAPIRSMDLLSVDGRLVVGVAGLGFDSAAAEMANRVRLRLGPALYAWAAFRTLLTFRAPALRVQVDGSEFFAGRAMLVALANTPRYGGGMRIAPAARIDDGLLNVVVVKQVSVSTFLRVFPKVYRGTHVEHPAVLTGQAHRVVVQADRPLPCYGDGERLHQAFTDTLCCEVLPRALRVVIPGVTQPH